MLENAVGVGNATGGGYRAHGNYSIVREPSWRKKVTLRKLGLKKKKKETKNLGRKSSHGDKVKRWGKTKQ